MIKWQKATTEDLDYLVNHPGIKPSTGFPVDAQITMAAVYAKPRNIGFTSKIGGMVFGHEGNSVFSSHFLFIPGSSGAEIKKLARAMLNEMFTRYGACAIKGYPPRENRAVRIIGVALGYHKIPNADFIDDFGRPCETYELRKM